jgi:hypothetical protein
VDAWTTIEAATGWSIPDWVRQGCVGPKLVTIPEGRELYAAGPAAKERMEWGAFEENDIGWYLQGNQLDPDWYLGERTERIPLYEYVVVLGEPTLAVMSKSWPSREPRHAPSRPNFSTTPRLASASPPASACSGTWKLTASSFRSQMPPDPAMKGPFGPAALAGPSCHALNS